MTEAETVDFYSRSLARAAHRHDRKPLAPLTTGTTDAGCNDPVMGDHNHCACARMVTSSCGERRALYCCSGSLSNLTLQKVYRCLVGVRSRMESRLKRVLWGRKALLRSGLIWHGVGAT